jgi:hypothetical protein
MNQAPRVLFVYFVITYIIPFGLFSVLDTTPIFRTPMESSYAVLWYIVTIALCCCVIALTMKQRIRGAVRLAPLQPISHRFLIWYLALNTLALVMSSSLGLVQWRYGSVGITDVPILALFALFYFGLMVVALWVLIADHSLLLSRSGKHMLLKVLLGVNIIGSINGLGTALFALFYVTILVSPQVMLGILFFSDDVSAASGNRTVVRRRVGVFAGAVIVCILLVNVAQPLFERGLVAKSGNDALADRALAFNEYTGTEYLINRHSVHMSQALASIDDGWSPDNLMIVPAAFAYRFDVLLGRPYALRKPVISSYSRQALVQFANFLNVNPRGGSSPGILATFSMSFPLPVALLMTALFLLIVAKYLNYLLYRQPRLTIVGAILLNYFFMGLLLDSPFDAFVPGPQMLIVLAFLWLSTKRQRSQKSLNVDRR